MAFSIGLYRNDSEKNKVNKTLVQLGAYAGELREETSLIDPVFRVQCLLSAAKTCNYLAVPEFGRQYFVEEIKSVREGILEFRCHVDVLTTYKTQLLTNAGIISRSEKYWNLYLNDNSFKVYENPTILTQPFPNGFTTPEFVLAVSGG